jgi:hypothetical protein
VLLPAFAKALPSGRYRMKRVFALLDVPNFFIENQLFIVFYATMAVGAGALHLYGYF